jgi:putative transposase
MVVRLIVIGRALAWALRGHRELVLENLALRQQPAAMKRATGRPHLQRRDRLFWIALTRIWRSWRTAVVLVQPDTVVRWHRDWLRRRWARRSKARPKGRPPVGARIRVLVREMATANPLWGAPRIHGELRTLGIDVSERTVSRLLQGCSRPPSQTWRTFLTNHVSCAASIDFFTVPTLTGRLLFVLVVLSHHCRRIAHVNITAHPTAAWSAQQMVEAFPDDTAPRWLHRDRDHSYGVAFQCRLAGMGIGEVVSAPASPWQNPYVEARDRLDPTRVSQSRSRAERSASPPHPRLLQPVLSWPQGRADAKGGGPFHMRRFLAIQSPQEHTHSFDKHCGTPLSLCSGLTARFQPRRLILSSVAVGCKPC